MILEHGDYFRVTVFMLRPYNGLTELNLVESGMSQTFRIFGEKDMDEAVRIAVDRYSYKDEGTIGVHICHVSGSDVLEVIKAPNCEMISD
jgi:hypothetical protein